MLWEIRRFSPMTFPGQIFAPASITAF